MRRAHLHLATYKRALEHLELTGGDSRTACADTQETICDHNRFDEGLDDEVMTEFFHRNHSLDGTAAILGFVMAFSPSAGSIWCRYPISHRSGPAVSSC
tara:strand:+ start:10529 stop:10825 length:297 start_codon:yes stop_codon:yes gene_type:complete